MFFYNISSPYCIFRYANMSMALDRKFYYYGGLLLQAWTCHIAQIINNFTIDNWFGHIGRLIVPWFLALAYDKGVFFLSFGQKKRLFYAFLPIWSNLLGSILTIVSLSNNLSYFESNKKIQENPKNPIFKTDIILWPKLWSPPCFRIKRDGGGGGGERLVAGYRRK